MRGRVAGKVGQPLTRAARRGIPGPQAWSARSSRASPALLLSLLIAVAAAVPSRQPPDARAAPAVEPAPGDVVLRRGDGIWSGFFSRLNRRDTRFSHAGVVVRDHGSLKVVHAEADDSGANGRVRLDEYRAFTAAGRGFVVLRLADREAAMRLGEAALSMHAQALPFDLDFDLADPAAVYCSELVWRALASALGRDPLPDKPVIAGRPVVLIENFLLDMPELQVVAP